ncbi:MAG: leucine--tRNA ligase [Dehalococcoidia bacterium]|nr:leucine--tRNA ligase [Dehalococcoidia bacterium]
MATMRQTELRYNPAELDQKWQARWEATGIYRVRDDDPRPKWYELTMYPYPSGDLHIGHWYAMAPADAHARFRHMQGYNVLHPMGFDAFGLPAENAAIKRGIHPYVWTMSNIENMRRQLRSMGAIYDWSREIVCCLPEYYKWNQWLFLKFYQAGLAYRALAAANWCDSCQTTLANEQVVNGLCERCDTTVYRREMEQWFLRTTRYADKLLQMDEIDWPEKIKTMQRNWIGRSEGVQISFDLSHLGLQEREIATFTTRIDTIYGVTLMVLAPEHPLVAKLTTPDRKAEVEAYVLQARRQTEVERLSTEREKTGVFLGSYCVNRLNGERVPLFIADYALLTYGTGAVMGVPAHDQRDYDFAKRYGLPVRVVVASPGWRGEELAQAWVGPGVMVNSGPFNGLPSDEAKGRIAGHIEGGKWGRRTVSYHMRDWLVSRQRYWGTPIPVIYCDHCGMLPVREEDLPVLLPEDAEFRPTGESPLKLHQGFFNTTCHQCHGPARRETDTLDTFFDSSWYFLRYASPHEDQAPFDPALARQWCPVDQYTGGAEHAVMHLLYARFFTKVMRDLGIVSFGEPFLRLYNQGTIIAGGAKMSKSRGNVVAPDEYVQALGADVVRAYLMFLGPWEQGGDWSDSGINGMARWLNRVWELAQRDPQELDASPVVMGKAEADRLRIPIGAEHQKKVRELQRAIHKTVKRVIADLDRFKFNTALAALMELTNAMARAWEQGGVDSATWREGVEKLLLLLAPMAPHITEELWERTGHAYSIHQQALPQWDEALAADEVITLVVQVNGKVRDRLQVPADISEEEAKRLALASPRVQSFTQGKRVEKLVYVPGKLVSVVVE